MVWGNAVWQYFLLLVNIQFIYLFITLNSHVCSSYKNVLRSDEEHEENEDGEAGVGTDANATAAWKTHKHRLTSEISNTAQPVLHYV